jgi:endonuclease V-like protein UPF0215 family
MWHMAQVQMRCLDLFVFIGEEYTNFMLRHFHMLLILMSLVEIGWLNICACNALHKHMGIP